MSKIQTIKDKDGNIVYPQTAVQAIYDESGKTLNTVLTDFVKADEAGSSVENVNNNPELIANKVTSIDSNSTDIQYPSAKAVYTSILANKSIGIQNAENTSVQVAKIWVGTQAQYDAIETKNANTEYNIIEG